MCNLLRTHYAVMDDHKNNVFSITLAHAYNV